MLICSVVTLGAPPSYDPEDSEEESVEVTPQGGLMLMSATGKPFGFINAEELTAFRTALASSLLIIRRTRVKTLICFGCGKQAYWHVRLALLLRGSTIKRVHFVTREFNDRATTLLKRFISYDSGIKSSEGWTDCKFDMAGMTYGEIDRILKGQVRAADVILCTTPSTAPLFDHTILTNTEGRMKPRLIIAIGSYKPHMIEIPPEVVKQAIKAHGHGYHFRKRAEEGGAIIVDTLACLTEAGELVQAGVGPERTVELGELVMLEQMRYDHDHENAIEDDSLTLTTTTTPSAVSDSPRTSIENLSIPSPIEITSGSLAKVFREDSTETNSSSKPASRKSSFTLSRKGSLRGLVKRPSAGSMSSLLLKGKKKQTEKEDEMSRWLSGGNVIYKSVGMGIMDLVVGGEVVRMAKAKGVGTTIGNF